ncbi:MAG: 1,4-alpha-glucan branching protein domain-containing protein [Bacillota bacterium]
MVYGCLSLLLHAHLPFVRHPENDSALEERWFFEACTECYIPLLNVFEKLADEGVDFRITVSLSPTLLSMMIDGLLQERYANHLGRSIELGVRECERTAGNRELNNLALMYLRHLENVRRYFYDCGGNLTVRFKNLSDRGRLELITTSATHGFLPLVHSREARRAQIEVGVNLFQRLFGHTPAGFWLAECAYDRGVDVLLKEAGIKYFIVDTHGLLSATPDPRYGIFAPVQCPSGVAAFGRDPESSRQVWERREGYPGHPEYREFYRDIGYDLDIDYLGPFLPEGKIRIDTGFKYYRITGPGEHRELYRPEFARGRAGIHARDFIRTRAAQLNEVSGMMDRTPLVLAPYDAELFGHWWFEGPSWLEDVLRFAGEGGVRTISPGDYLKAYPENQVVNLHMSSWGEGGFSYVWLNKSNDWIYRHQHVAEKKMTEMADRERPARGIIRRALNQAGRELLLAQSSDWAFIIKQETTVEYASKRVAGHLGNFSRLAEQITSGSVDEEFLGSLEYRDNIFPDLDYNVFGSVHISPETFYQSGKRIIMLSWEYPPRTVGGLGRHVHELSRALSSIGLEVHVFTCPALNCPPYEVDDMGVHVHRIGDVDLEINDFLTWLRALNRGMVREVTESGLLDGRFHLVHAHDWLVRDAAGEITEKSGLPLVVTIHATEYGRNKGIFTELQRMIHSIEQDQVSRADQVICCSNYMAREVGRLFGSGKSGIRVIPNGVNPDNLASGLNDGDSGAGGAGPLIAFLGRLVPEKGIQVLIEAMPRIRAGHPGAVLVVAGRGPYEEDLKSLARHLGQEDNIKFIGFVDDAGRNRLLAEASVAVFPSIYEPFGIVALEAMAAGTPLVVSETGGLSEIISHGIDGIKVQPGNAAMLADHVSQLLARPDLADRLRKNAYRKVLSRYNWKQIAYETALIYMDVIGKKARGSESCA